MPRSEGDGQGSDAGILSYEKTVAAPHLHTAPQDSSSWNGRRRGGRPKEACGIGGVEAVGKVGGFAGGQGGAEDQADGQTHLRNLPVGGAVQCVRGGGVHGRVAVREAQVPARLEPSASVQLCVAHNLSCHLEAVGKIPRSSCHHRL